MNVSTIKLMLSGLLMTGVMMSAVESVAAASLTLEAESGVLGSDWAVSNNASPTYLAITTDSTGTSPGSAARVATYTVTFPAAGSYDLYARVQVGPNGFNDDSMFYGGGLGAQDPAASSDWILVNGLATAGFDNSTDVVTGGGTLGSGMWKWINLSQFDPSGSGSSSPITSTVPTGSLTQTFQIGARENGLALDQFVFGTAGYTFTVSNLDHGTDGTPASPSVTTIDPTRVYQTIEGLGGATCFWVGNLSGHPYKMEIYTNLFAGLNLSMLRLGDWYRYQSSINSFDSAAADVVANANRVLGHPVPVYMSSWSPPAFLKSNGQTGNGGTLITNAAGAFDYAGFAQYWYDSLQAYRSNGISPSWISIQNEPDWVAGYDSCVFHPTEDTVNGTNYASYSKALDAVHQKLTTLPSPPKLLAPEVVHIAYNDLANYAATLNGNSFYGINYHLYGGDNSDLSSSTNIFPGKPHFMTELGVDDLIGAATLIHNCLTLGQDSGFNFWSLAWPAPGGGLVEVENGGSPSSWTNAPAAPTEAHGWYRMPSYWAMKHFSYFINPGYRRVSASDTDGKVLSSAYVSPDGLRLVVVLINTNATAPSAMDFNFGSFNVGKSSVYQTAGTNTVACTNTFLPLGSLASPQTLPPQSVTTVVLDRFVAVGAASQPSPAPNASGVALDSELSWTPGSNALLHAIYLGVNSNAVAQASPASPQFLGIVPNAGFYPPLFGNTTNYWRVDEIAGAYTNPGAVWSFSAAPTPALVHRYSFSETGGTNTVDSIGGPAWTGTLPNGGALAAGRLTLSSGSSQYVNLPPGIVGALSNFTVMAWVNLAATANWARIFDFGDNETDYLFLAPQNGNTGKVRYAITTASAGSEQQINCNSTLTPGTWHQVAVTLNGHTGILYVDGAPAGTNGAMALNPASLGSTANNYLGKSQWPDPYLDGQMDEFRIYSVALSAAEVAATDALGPDQLLSTNRPVAAVSRPGGNLALSWPLASAGFTLQFRTNFFEGGWLNLTSPAPQIVGGQWQVILPATNRADSLFYRLVNQSGR